MTEWFETWCKTEGITIAKCDADGTYINSKAFYAWKALQAQQKEGFVLVPVKPTEACLESMALRYRHDFGVTKDPDQPIDSGVTPQERVSILTTMGQLYEEATGQGFYKLPPLASESDDKLNLVRVAIEGYYQALKNREHGGVAQSRALTDIEMALGMSWTEYEKGTSK